MASQINSGRTYTARPLTLTLFHAIRADFSLFFYRTKLRNANGEIHRQTQDVARLAEAVAKAGNGLLEALKIEKALKNKRVDVAESEVRRIRRTVDECAEVYLTAVSRYVEFFQRATGEED